MSAAAGAPGPGAGPGAGEAGRRLVDEALRFVEALRDTGGHPASDPMNGAVTDPLPDPTNGPGPASAHTGAECRACPVCRLVTVVRTLRPEAVEHLALAAAELASAWREVVAGPAPADPPPAPQRDEPIVERIDVTD